MKSSPLSIAILLVGLVAGYLVGAGSGERPANAQGAGAPSAGRYQISSWGEHGTHGAYVVDTVGGQVWRIEQQQSPRKLADKLP